ncbi:MAG: zinc ribbon domain-containing protein [Candidatus Hermodarchaeota archaeon]
MYCGNCGKELQDPNQQFCLNCGIPLKYLNIRDSLKKNFEIIAGAIIKDRRIIYTTDNWDISGDVDSLLSSWFGQNAQFITISGVKYTILQMEAERLVAMSYSGVESIVATKDDEYIIILRVITKKLSSVGKKIKSIMKNNSINELTIERQYLPEIFGADVLKISKDDGLPVLGPYVMRYLFTKGVSTDIFGNIIKFKKVKPHIDFELIAPEPKLYPVPKEKGEIKHSSRDIKRVDSKLRDEIFQFKNDLNWNKDSEGLAGYINYLLQQNNPQLISKFLRIYNEIIPKERAPKITEKKPPKVVFTEKKPPKVVFTEKKLPKEKAPTVKKVYKINEYITLKLEDKRTYIYINGKRFLQCIRLFLQIPPQERDLYEEIESIDEAVKVYKQSLWENRIVEGQVGIASQFQNITITPEQEFWGHCSNLQVWVEHNYDTRLLMSNISFPVLKKLTEAGDPMAKRVFKEEIAQRLKSGYPSVVKYLIILGYISQFTSFEFKTIIDTTTLIKIVSSQPKMLSNFLQKCAKRFPTILGDIVLKILELPEGKENLYTSSSRESWHLSFSVPLDSNPKFLEKIKDALIEKLDKVREDKKGDILDYIQIIDDNVNEEKREREAKNFEFERAELKKIVKSFNLKTREMLEVYPQEKLMIQNLEPMQRRNEIRKLQYNFYFNYYGQIGDMITELQDRLKIKLKVLGKMKINVSDFISQAKNLMRLTIKLRKKINSRIKDLAL